MNLPVPASVSKNCVATAWNHTGTCSNVSSWISQEEVAKFKLKCCIKNLYGHSESEFLFDIFQLASLWLWGFILHQCGWVTPVPARKRCKHSCVPKLLKVGQNLFPMDVEFNMQQGKELCVVSYQQLQLMLFFTLCKVAEWSLVIKKIFNNSFKNWWRLRI